MKKNLTTLIASIVALSLITGTLTSCSTTVNADVSQSTSSVTDTATPKPTETTPEATPQTTTTTTTTTTPTSTTTTTTTPTATTTTTPTVTTNTTANSTVATTPPPVPEGDPMVTNTFICYSRKSDNLDSEGVTEYPFGSTVYVKSEANNGFYLLSDGTFMHKSLLCNTLEEAQNLYVPIPNRELQGPRGETMYDNRVLDSLQYLGYRVDKLKEGNNLYRYGHYGESATMNNGYFSGITYSTWPTDGLELNEEGKPDLEYFRENGLCCASYTAFYFCRYLPMIKGVEGMEFFEESLLNVGRNLQSVLTWTYALLDMTEKGQAEVIYSNPYDFLSTDRIVNMVDLHLNDIIIFKTQIDENAHIAIYLGQQGGTHFVAHVGGPAGPSIQSLEILEYYEISEPGGGGFITAVYRVPQANT